MTYDGLFLQKEFFDSIEFLALIVKGIKCMKMNPGDVADDARL